MRFHDRTLVNWFGKDICIDIGRTVPYFLGGMARFPPEAYEEIGQIAPRASWRTAPGSIGVFLSGIRPEEAEQFARWIGHGFRLPTSLEWRDLDRAFGNAGDRLGPIRKIANDSRTHPAARAVLRGWLLTM